MDAGVKASEIAKLTSYSKRTIQREIKMEMVALNNRNGKSIDERPEEVENRKKIGHWQIDGKKRNRVCNSNACREIIKIENIYK